MDAFFLSHTFEPVDVPDQAQVDRFLPPPVPRIVLDTKAPQALGQMAGPAVYMEMRRDIQQAMEAVPGWLDRIEEEFAAIFDRRYGAVEAVGCQDADIVIVVTGSVTGTSREVIEGLRSRGEKAGMLKLRLFRPFPLEGIRRILGGVRKVAVIDRNFSFGASGIFAQEIRAALCNLPGHPPVYGYVAGLGGRDETPEQIEAAYLWTRDAGPPKAESLWLGLADKEMVAP
jgi:pyruvate/2-oxoacid:ferredoxin oxidoreductase alpha subunit